MRAQIRNATKISIELRRIDDAELGKEVDQLSWEIRDDVGGILEARGAILEDTNPTMVTDLLEVVAERMGVER